MNNLTDCELETRLKELVVTERSNTHDILEHLGEFDQRDLYQPRFASLYLYCRGELRYSEGAAYRRIHCARAAREHPGVLTLIRTGELTLSVVSVLAPHLTMLNAESLLACAMGKSKRDVLFLVAAIAPKPEPRDFIQSTVSHLTARPHDSLSAQGAIIPGAASLPAQDRIQPLTEQSVRIAFTAARRVLDKLEKAKGLLRHKHPLGRLDDVVEEALDALLDKRDPSRKQKPAEPREVLPGRRRIPRWVKDRVWKRDGGRCSYAATDGRRCEETSWLEYDHIIPFGLAGRSDEPSNVRLLCRAHNQWTARAAYTARP